MLESFGVVSPNPLDSAATVPMAGQEAGSDKQCHVFYAYTVRGKGKTTPVQPVLIYGLIDCKQNVREKSHLDQQAAQRLRWHAVRGIGVTSEGVK